jgi:hypothetical protein
LKEVGEEKNEDRQASLRTGNLTLDSFGVLFIEPLSSRGSEECGHRSFREAAVSIEARAKEPHRQAQRYE